MTNYNNYAAPIAIQGFTGEIHLQLGAVFMIPEDYKVYEVGSGRFSKPAVDVVVYGEDMEYTHRFYLSSLTQSLEEYDADADMPTGRVRCSSGSAVELYKQAHNNLDVLVNKRIQITNIEFVPIKNEYNNRLYNLPIHTLELV